MTSKKLALTITLALMTLPLATIPTSSWAQSAEKQLNENTYIDIARNVLPSVVNLTVKDVASSREEMAERYRELLEQFSDPSGPMQPMPFGEASGSGVVVRRNGDLGYILTNNHVVDSISDNRELMVTFHLPDESGTEYTETVIVEGDDVRVIGRDELSDLAVVEYDWPDGLDVKPIGFADSDKALVGEMIVALGNPLDLTSTVTQGIISAKSRYLSASISLEKLIQTDAVIQPGNSGGPLVNLDGQIVGINNAIASRNGLWQGISFAIPSNDAKRISDELIEYGRVLRGFLGIEMDNARWRPNVTEKYQVEDRNGVIVARVVESTPAEEAGLQMDDLIRKIDNAPVEDSEQMLRIIANKPVNTEITIELIRLDEDNQPFTFETTAALTERPQQRLLQEMSPPRDQRGSNDGPVQSIESLETFGMTLIPMISRNQVNGFIVTDIVAGSKAAEADLEEGDVITSIDGKIPTSIEEMAEIIKELDSKEVSITLERMGSTVETTLDLSN